MPEALEKLRLKLTVPKKKPKVSVLSVLRLIGQYTSTLSIPTNHFAMLCFRSDSRLGVIMAFLLVWPFMMTLSLLRPLHVVLRKIGFHNGRLPLDFAQRWFASYLLLVLGMSLLSCV